MLRRISGFAFVVALSVLMNGCAPEQTPQVPVMTDNHDHDHGHHHDHGEEGHVETLDGAIHELEELRDTVSEAAEKKDMESAHEPLHEVGHLLGEVKELADDSELSDDAKKAIAANVETLMDTFGAIDKKMHSEDEGSDYNDVAEKIDAAIEAIEEAAEPVLGDHDHDDDDHDHEEGDDHEEKEETPEPEEAESDEPAEEE